MKYRNLMDLGLFLEAFILLHVSKLIILFIPFRKIAERLGGINAEQHFIGSDLAKVKAVHVAIMRAVKISVHSSKCYDQALTARCMLGRRKIPTTIYFGLAKDGDTLSAHAWVSSGEFIVTGKGGMHNFTPVATFTDPVSIK